MRRRINGSTLDSDGASYDPADRGAVVAGVGLATAAPLLQCGYPHRWSYADTATMPSVGRGQEDTMRLSDRFGGIARTAAREPRDGYQ